MQLDQLFCGLRFAPWRVESLREAIKTDHGYTLSSAPVQALLRVLCTFDRHQQRQFLSFVTGCPSLPVGGFAALTPRLTVVCKATAAPDMDLPSVMTCQNYFKLPPYSSEDVLARRLALAMAEGQGSFHLS